jgi:hypothetical protein
MVNEAPKTGKEQGTLSDWWNNGGGLPRFFGGILQEAHGVGQVVAGAASAAATELGITSRSKLEAGKEMAEGVANITSALGQIGAGYLETLASFTHVDLFLEKNGFVGEGPLFGARPRKDTTLRADNAAHAAAEEASPVGPIVTAANTHPAGQLASGKRPGINGFRVS